MDMAQLFNDVDDLANAFEALYVKRGKIQDSLHNQLSGVPFHNWRGDRYVIDHVSITDSCAILVGCYNKHKEYISFYLSEILPYLSDKGD